MEAIRTVLNDPLVNFVTDAGQLAQQASAFNGVAKVYAPRYRQVSLSLQQRQPTWNNGEDGRNETSALQRAMDIAYADIVRAFEQFLKWNQGRPFLIASHSQGTMHLKRLIKERLQVHRRQIVAAYLIGNCVSVDELPSWLPLCTSSIQTGCFISYNSMIESGDGSHWQSKTTSRLACVNPLTWKNDTESWAPRSLHLGSFPVSGHLFLADWHSHLIEARCTKDGLLEVRPDPGDQHWDTLKISVARRRRVRCMRLIFLCFIAILESMQGHGYLHFYSLTLIRLRRHCARHAVQICAAFSGSLCSYSLLSSSCGALWFSCGFLLACLHTVLSISGRMPFSHRTGSCFAVECAAVVAVVAACFVAVYQ